VHVVGLAFLGKRIRRPVSVARIDEDPAARSLGDARRKISPERYGAEAFV
jgi:hypothetical protein